MNHSDLQWITQSNTVDLSWIDGSTDASAAASNGGASAFSTLRRDSSKANLKRSQEEIGTAVDLVYAVAQADVAHAVRVQAAKVLEATAVGAALKQKHIDQYTQAAITAAESAIAQATTVFKGSEKASNITRAGDVGDAAIAAATASGQNLITEITSQNSASATYTSTANTIDSTLTTTINSLTVPHTQGTQAAMTTADVASATALRGSLASAGTADVNWITTFANADATRTGSQASAQANWVTSSVQSGSSVLLWNCGDIVTANASGSWASQYAPARTAMITTTALVDAGRQIAAWFDRTVRDNDQADADVQYIQSIASPETQLAVSATQRGNQYATSSTNTSNDLSTDLDTSGANIQSTSAAVEKTAAVDSATAWKAYQVALASLDEGAATTAVEKAYQDALAQVTRNSRVAYANLTYTEGVAQIGSVGDAITDMGQAGKTYITNLAGNEKAYTDTTAPIIGARTLLYTQADNNLRKAITTADNVWRNNTAQAWGTHTAGDLVARGAVRRTLANTSNLLADASNASIAELKAQWWQNEIPNYLQWSVDIGGIETTYTNNTTANILLRTTGVKNAGVTYASTVGTAIQAFETTTATAREQYLSTLMTVSETAAEATLRADRDKEIALADADLQKQLTGNESAHTTAVNNANSAHSTATANAEAARKSAEQAALSQLNSTLAQATKDKESSIAGAERTYDQTVASLDAQYGSESSNGDTGVEGAMRRSAIKTRDAQYYAARDTSWANTLSGSTTLGTSPWTVKAISAANAQAAYSTSRASAQAAHDAAMLDAMEDWKDATSTAFFNSLVSSSNAKRDYTNSLAGHWADWEEATDGKTGEAPDVPTESMVDSIIGILNPFDTESIANAAITKPSDVPRRPDPSEIKLVYSIYGIVSEHTPEEWEVIREYQTRGRTWEDWLYGNERERMENAGFKTSFRHLDEETPPSKIPTPSILPSPPPILPESPAHVEPPGNTTIPTPEAEPYSGLGLTDTIIGVFGGTRGDYVDQTFNFLYGVGDNMSLGIGWWLRSTFFDDQADYGGNSYYIGSWVGFVADLAIGGAFKSLGKAFGKELLEQGARNVPMGTSSTGASHVRNLFDDLPSGTGVGGVTRSFLQGSPEPWRLFKPSYKVEIHMPVGLRAADPRRYARNLSHEIRHALDFLYHPQFAYYATKSKAPGAGLAHYVFEARGYLQSHGVRALVDPRIPGPMASVRSFTINRVPQMRHRLVYRDLLIVGSIIGYGSGLYFGGAYNSSTYVPWFED